MKRWQEKEFYQSVFYDDVDGKIIGVVYRVGTQNTIWGAKVYTDMEGVLGQYIDSDYAKKAVELFWDVQSRTVLEYTDVNLKEAK
jgi:hypothetical protein